MDPKQILYSYFEEQFPFNKEGLKDFVDSFEIKCYQKNDLLLTPDSGDTKLRFLIKGCVREFYATDEKEINIMFYIKPEFITDFSYFDHQSVTHKWQQALTYTELLILDKRMFQKLLNQYPCGKSFIESVFRKIIDTKETIEFNRLTKAPEELYKCIIENNKDWLNQIPQYHIALFIGISPETLSRIRKRIY